MLIYIVCNFFFRINILCGEWEMVVDDAMMREYNQENSLFTDVLPSWFFFSTYNSTRSGMAIKKGVQLTDFSNCELKVLLCNMLAAFTEGIHSYFQFRRVPLVLKGGTYQLLCKYRAPPRRNTDPSSLQGRGD